MKLKNLKNIIDYDVKVCLILNGLALLCDDIFEVVVKKYGKLEVVKIKPSKDGLIIEVKNNEN